MLPFNNFKIYKFLYSIEHKHYLRKKLDVKKGVSTFSTTKRQNTKIILIAKITFCLHFPCANANITFEQLGLFMGKHYKAITIIA